MCAPEVNVYVKISASNHTNDMQFWTNVVKYVFLMPLSTTLLAKKTKKKTPTLLNIWMISALWEEEVMKKTKIKRVNNLSNFLQLNTYRGRGGSRQSVWMARGHFSHSTILPVFPPQTMQCATPLAYKLN